MIEADVQQVQSGLTDYLRRVAAGETVVIHDHGHPVAELRAVAQRALTPRPIGLAKGTFDVPDDFNEPLPADVLDAFEGRGP